jgi:hypothetical protein
MYMTTHPMHDSLALLFAELIDGPPSGAAYMLNGGDPGLLRSLDRLSSEAASTPAPAGGAPIAAHVDHLCYGLELMLRWSAGDPDPWTGADWAASWRCRSVTDDEWAGLRERLRAAARRWHAVLQTPRDLSPAELNGVISSIPHLAYHVGAIRQIDRRLQGPKAE